MNLPAASGGVSRRRYIIYEVRSARKLFNCGFVTVQSKYSISEPPQAAEYQTPLRMKKNGNYFIDEIEKTGRIIYEKAKKTAA
jgi:hypothetical protein